MKSKFSEMYKHPRWQKKRLEIMSKNGFICDMCCDTNTTLNVHHRWYKQNRYPWEYPDFCFQVLCENCHREESKRSEDKDGNANFEDWELAMMKYGAQSVIEHMYDKDYEDFQKWEAAGCPQKR